MVAKHTQGTWFPQQGVEIGDVEIVSEGNPLGVAELATVHGSAEYTGTLPAEANGQLMAAAPQLLAALTAARENISDERLSLRQYGQLIDRIDAAIDAAVGE